MPIKLGVIGIDHGHIFGMLSSMQDEGCACDAYWTDGPAVTETKFNQVFPEVVKVEDRRRILDDPDISMILISGRRSSGSTRWTRPQILNPGPCWKCRCVRWQLRTAH